jgi:hypothetical protein
MAGVKRLQRGAKSEQKHAAEHGEAGGFGRAHWQIAFLNLHKWKPRGIPHSADFVRNDESFLAAATDLSVTRHHSLSRSWL